MLIDFKYFHISTINFSRKRKYSEKNIIFNNHFDDEIIAEKVLIKMNELFKKLEEVNWKDFENNFMEEKNWGFKDRNEDVEPALLVMMGYGLSRNHVISKIFEGYCSRGIGTENEVQESLISIPNKIVKAPLFVEHNRPNKERIIFLWKRETLYPLFIDVNHSLYHSTPSLVVSNKKLEILFKKYFCKFVDALSFNKDMFFNK